MELLCSKCNDDILKIIKKDGNIFNYIDIIRDRISNNIFKKNN